MDRQKRKELSNSYTSRKKIGAVIAICCEGSGKRLIMSVPDLPGYENRFSFSKQINSPVHEKLRKDWFEFGAGSFTLNVLETLEKKEDQTDRDFGECLQILLEIHTEKDSKESLY
jgi:hypothetical protein